MVTTENGSGENKDELLQRIELMETMIAEGRRSTVRNGWIFVLWGSLYFAAVGWELFLPFRNWAWPVCMGAGVVITIVVRVRQRRTAGGTVNMQSRSIMAVWRMMGTAVSLFAFTGILTHHAGGTMYMAAILFFIGLAHATSAMILRWRVQGAVAAIWWVGGMAIFFANRWQESLAIFLTASFFGMILFGLYAMMLERRREAVQKHA
ncbi:MAG TPA: hypothetical protein VNU94_06395 [Acidobacteriaceae bacterium]|jgi:hypothetical protein|nr:hypothetical protein [Acidobacteriaceae bacterium]